MYNNIFDSHAHYDDDSFSEDLTELLEGLPSKGISHVVNCGTDINSCEKLAEISHISVSNLEKTFKKCYGMTPVVYRNTIRIEEAKKLSYPIPCSIYDITSPNRNLVRKTQCHAGWDWGPCIMAMGVYNSLKIIQTKTLVVQTLFQSLKQNQQTMHVYGRKQVKLLPHVKKTAKLHINVLFMVKQKLQPLRQMSGKVSISRL